MNHICVNLFGGPCAGKSTVAYGISCLLKLHGLSCEYVSEYAKSLTWEKRELALRNQFYVFGKQHHKMFRVYSQVSAAVTDTSFILGIAYGDPRQMNFHKAIIEAFNEFNNLNFLIERNHCYIGEGRNQNEEEAVQKDNEIRDVLKKFEIPYVTLKSGHETINSITEQVAERILGHPLNPRYKIIQIPESEA